MTMREEFFEFRKRIEGMFREEWAEKKSVILE